MLSQLTKVWRQLKLCVTAYLGFSQSLYLSVEFSVASPNVTVEPNCVGPDITHCIPLTCFIGL